MNFKLFFVQATKNGAHTIFTVCPELDFCAEVSYQKLAEHGVRELPQGTDESARVLAMALKHVLDSNDPEFRLTAPYYYEARK